MKFIMKEKTNQNLQLDKKKNKAERINILLLIYYTN